MSDYIVRAAAADGKIRALAATTRGLVEEARQIHNTSPVMTAALGRLLTAAAILGAQMKGDEDRLTLRIKGDGPAESLYAVADSHGHVKGFAANPQVLLHARADGKLDVGGAIGKGELTVTRDLGLKEPYIGSLGVLTNKDNTVAQAGGFMLQLLPGVSDEEAARLEERILAQPSVTTLLTEGKSPEEILHILLHDFGMEEPERSEVSFRCDCSREKMEGVLVGLGRHEMMDLMLSQETVEVHCDYCNTYYRFSRSEMKELFKKHYRNV